MIEMELNLIRDDAENRYSLEQMSQILGSLRSPVSVYTPEDTPVFRRFINDLPCGITHMFAGYPPLCIGNDGISASPMQAGIQSKEDKPGEDALWVTNIIKMHFNPLLPRQDIVFFDSGHVLFYMPYKLMRLSCGFPSVINLCLSNCKDDRTAFVFKCLVRYALTKDLAYLSGIIQKKLHFNLTAIKMVRLAFEAEADIDVEALRSCADLLNESVTERVKKKNAPLSIPAQQQITKCVSGADKNTLIKRGVSSTSNKPHNARNLIVLHLESLSNEIYHNHMDKLPHLNALLADSVYFTKFYTTATSSAMAVIDFLYGNDFETDRFTTFDDILIDRPYGQNLYQTLADHGYQTLGLGYNKRAATEEINRFKSWNVNGDDYVWEGEYDGFVRHMEGFIAKNHDRPFGMHIWNLLTHVGHMDEQTDRFVTFTERMDISYECLDHTVERLLAALRQHNLLENTTILAYGDHGDDKWTRGINSGCTHIVEPYLNVISAPAFIYDARLVPAMRSQTASLIDLRSTALHLLGIDAPRRFDYEGINLFEHSNDYVFSRSLMTNQREQEPIRSPQMIQLNRFSDVDQKAKAFCIVDKKYSLLAGPNGVELFMHTIDPFGYSNLLTFFHFDEDGNIAGFDNRGAWKGHFRGIIMVDEQIYEIMAEYDELRAKLKDRISLKNELIQESIGNQSQTHFFDMRHFNKIKPREYIW